ncbi:MAG: c-type cytochrome [candidate division Zixibacteria bacterium]|nr:c-type cytochrome [candidate division Zixibacteria bacterium]
MSEEYNEEILDHEYDGIQEMDNNLPKWWLYLFIFTIGWAVLYMLYYHVFQVGYLQEDEYRQEMNPNYIRVAESDLKVLGLLPEYHSPYHNPRGDVTPRSLIASHGKGVRVMMTAATDTVTYITLIDPTSISEGKNIFLTNCAQCHGNLGEGGVGPNLTDDYWLHKDDISSIVKSVKYGYPAKGMIPWLGTLKEDDVVKTASFIQTLRGTKPPNGRAPQGELVTE